jgi:hypothetical protein
MGPGTLPGTRFCTTPPSPSTLPQGIVIWPRVRCTGHLVSLSERACTFPQNWD